MWRLQMENLVTVLGCYQEFSDVKKILIMIVGCGEGREKTVCDRTIFRI